MAEGYVKGFGAADAYLIKKSPKPNNVGSGTHLKNINTKLSNVNKAMKTADDIFGKLAYVGVGLETAENAHVNYSNGASAEKIVWDAAMDVSFSGVNTCVSGVAATWATNLVAGKIGASLGACAGPVGLLAGFVIGFAVAYGLSKISDSSREEMKSFVQ